MIAFVSDLTGRERRKALFAHADRLRRVLVAVIAHKASERSCSTEQVVEGLLHDTRVALGIEEPVAENAGA